MSTTPEDRPSTRLILLALPVWLLGAVVSVALGALLLAMAVVLRAGMAARALVFMPIAGGCRLIERWIRSSRGRPPAPPAPPAVSP